MAVIWPEVLLLTIVLVERCNSEDTYLLPGKKNLEDPMPLAAVTGVDDLHGDFTEMSLDWTEDAAPEVVSDNFPPPVDVTLASPIDHVIEAPEINPHYGGSGSEAGGNTKKPPPPHKTFHRKMVLLKQRLAVGVVNKGEQDSSVSGKGEFFDDTNFAQENGTLVADVSASTEAGPNTPRSIYIRGHLLRGQPARTFHPAEDSDGYFRAPNSIHRTYIKDFREEPTNNSGPSRQKRKHSDVRKKFYNYKMLHGSSSIEKDQRHKKTEFYAWIFGASMLTLGTLTTMTSCFVFCFCGDKIRKRRQNRRSLDKSGEYQRVESVSSIVDNADLQQEPYDDDEPVDNVTII